VTLTNVKAPTVVGKMKVGKKVKAKTGTWSTQPASFTYQWLSNGKAIKGAKAKKVAFKLTKKVKGKKVSVRVTAVKPGSPKAVATSKARKVK
jgi:hypothetical protein